jgi:hypothetical protein
MMTVDVAQATRFHIQYCLLMIVVVCLNNVDHRRDNDEHQATSSMNIQRNTTSLSTGVYISIYKHFIEI